jgi:hypothetical protein
MRLFAPSRPSRHGVGAADVYGAEMHEARGRNISNGDHRKSTRGE